jgi:hypothetical protein
MELRIKLKTWTNERLFASLLQSHSSKGHWERIFELRERPCDEVYLRCVKLAHSANAKERCIGIDILAQLGQSMRKKGETLVSVKRPYEKETLRLYFDLLETGCDDDALKSILHGIGHNNRHLTLARLKQLVRYQTHKKWFVRYALVHALMGVDKAPAIDAEIALSADRSAQVRDWATFALGQQIKTDMPAIREALWKRVNDKDQGARHEALYGLATRKDARVVDILWRELRSGDAENETLLLFEAIERLGATEFLPALEQKLEAVQQEEGVSTWWLEVLADIVAALRQGQA